MSRRVVIWGASALLTVGLLSSATARPQYLMTFKAHYNTAQNKPTLNASPCVVCHIGMPAQKNFNVYGTAVRGALGGATNVQDRAQIVAAFQKIESQQNPATNQTFIQMINADQQPGHAPAGSAGGGSLSGEWIPLFNGVNMDGWTKMNAGDWKVENGLLRYTGGGNGWLRSNNQYGNYAMVVIWKYAVPGTGMNNDSGVFLKAPMEGNPWPGGPQLNLGPMQNFGSIGGTQGSQARFDLIRPDDWNTYQVTVRNGVATLAINGQTAWPQATGIPTGQGYIGLQAENRAIDFAQIWLMPLP